MAKMRAVQVTRAGGPLELVERDLPEPARGEVRIRIEACGVCHSDSFTVENMFPGLVFPLGRLCRVPLGLLRLLTCRGFSPVGFQECAGAFRYC